MSNPGWSHLTYVVGLNVPDVEQEVEEGAGGVGHAVVRPADELEVGDFSRCTRLKPDNII